MLYCENCGKEIDGNFGSGRFCNNSCRASYTNKHRARSDESKEKTRQSLLKYNKDHNLGRYKLNVRICVVCGNEFIPERRSDSNRLRANKTCSPECNHKLMSDKSRKARLKEISEGTFKGWISRNIVSYPEQFFMKVLDNNEIKYKHNKGFWYNGYDHYFLDFFIDKNGKKLDLEIDGKQHEYLDRKESDAKRDEILESNGFIIYRIKWNEINSQSGKESMNDKINKFLKFYNDI